MHYNCLLFVFIVVFCLPVYVYFLSVVCPLFFDLYFIYFVQKECVGMYFVVSDGAPDRWEQRKWYNPPMNFDNTGTALLTLFEIAGLELWMTPMYSAMDATDLGHQPKRNNNRYACFYFLVFILFGSFLVLYTQTYSNTF